MTGDLRRQGDQNEQTYLATQINNKRTTSMKYPKLTLSIFLSLITHNAFCKTVSISVTNQSHQTIYISANNESDLSSKIDVSPSTLSTKAQSKTILFKKIIDHDAYFEIYFGKFLNDENCTFAYDFSHGISLAECPDISYSISADGQSITLR